MPLGLHTRVTHLTALYVCVHRLDPIDGGTWVVALRTQKKVWATKVVVKVLPRWHGGMILSISLSDEDLAALDRYVHAAGVPSRSAAIQRAIRMLRDPELEDAYAAAWGEWQASGEATAWEVATADGLADAAR